MCLACSSVQLLSHVQLFVTPMDCSTLGFPAHHQLLELAQTHVHWVSDATQPSQSRSSPSPPAFNLSQHQGLFQWGSSSHQVAKVSGLPYNPWVKEPARSLQSCLPLRPYGLQPSRLLCPQDFPGKNTGVDCHFFLHQRSLGMVIFNWFGEMVSLD